VTRNHDPETGCRGRLTSCQLGPAHISEPRAGPELSLVTVVVTVSLDHDGYAMMSAMEERYTMVIMALDAGRLRGATRNGEYYHDMMACDGSSKPEFVQVQVA